MVTISEAMTTALRAYQAGNSAEAEWLCQQIVKQQLDYIPALHLLGTIAHQTNRLESAISYYQRIVAREPNHFEAHSNLAVALQTQGQLAAAANQFEQALRINPTHARIQFNYGNLLAQQQNYESAIDHYQQAVALNPDYIDALINLGNALRELEQWDAAVSQYERALKLQPDHVEVHYNLGNALREIDRPEAAVVHYQLALKRDPNQADIHSNLALTLQEQNQLEAAIAHFDQAIALNPRSAQTRFNRSMALLASGDLQRGFAEYEWRWQCKEMKFRSLSGERWHPTHSAGQTVLLLTEQGFGDAIQFVRYATLLAERGDRVIIHCPAELARLFRTVSGVTQVIPWGDPLPDYNAYVFLMSLPHLLNHTLETLPSQPYLSVADSEDSRKVIRIRPASNSGQDRSPPHLGDLGGDRVTAASDGQTDRTALQVGMVWASGLRPHRTLFRYYSSKTASLPLLMQARSIPNVTLHSLQVGAHAADIRQFGFAGQIQDWSDRLTDFADTAAAIVQLDLVISVDTAVAHLAGALGKPVWLLLPFNADWRWLLDREDSPWYPTMRLFRQPRLGDWSSVMQQVVQALPDMATKFSES